jgi:transposase
MEVLVARCAGLDVHQAVIVACVLIAQANGRSRKEQAEFSSTASGLAGLAAWLRQFGVSHVGMEATGVYWMTVYAALEACGGFELIVANALHIKAVPGRKTDVRDAEWLARLIRHGLVRKSFIPDKPFRILRDLLRYRRTLIETQASERRRLIKLLETADIKLAGVVSDIFGVTGRAILQALIAGQQSVEAMADLARGHLRRKRAALREALGAAPQEHQRKMLAIQLTRVEASEADIARLDQEIDERLQPYGMLPIKTAFRIGRAI